MSEPVLYLSLRVALPAEQIGSLAAEMARVNYVTAPVLQT